MGGGSTVGQVLDEFLDPAEPRLYLIAAGGGHGLVGVLLAVACRPASPAVLADGVGGRGEDATDLAPSALPAALGALADLSPLGLGSVYLGLHSGHCPPQTALDRDGFPVNSACSGWKRCWCTEVMRLRPKYSGWRRMLSSASAELGGRTATTSRPTPSLFSVHDIHGNNSSCAFLQAVAIRIFSDSSGSGEPFHPSSLLYAVCVQSALGDPRVKVELAALFDFSYM